MASTINVKIAPLPRGEYSSSATYAKLDVVSYNGSSYMAIKAVPTGTVPTNTTYWQLLAEKPTIGEGTITTNMLADGAVTADKLDSSVSEVYAEVSGTYEDMVVGSAEQLLSTQYDTDSVPYAFRKSPYGDREFDEIVGGTVAFNQLNDNARASQTVGGITFTNNADGSWTLNGTASANDSKTFSNQFSLGNNHVYYVKGCPSGGSASTYFFGIGGLIMDTGNGGFWKNTSNFASGNANFAFKSGVSFSSVKIYPIIIDLTQMFGTAVADYIYGLGQTDGVAFFRGLFPKPYYAYNTGELISVSGLSAHKMTGFNQWDEEWEVGGIMPNGQPSTSTNEMRCKNYIPAFPYTQYCFTTPLWGVIYQYDADKNFLLRTPLVGGDSSPLFTTLANTAYLKFYLQSAYGTTYKHDICINISGERNGQYEPYESHSYALDDSLTLRGVPKLNSANEMYFDGDVYASDGTVQRRYGIVDLGTLSWNYDNTSYAYAVFISGAIATRKGGALSGVCSRYIVNNGGRYSLGSGDKQIASYNESGATSLSVRDDAYTSASAFQTAMSGVYLVYELATPTIESASPYVSPQICNEYGTEEYVSAEQDGVTMIVGHNTKYPQNLRKKIEGLPWNFSNLIAPTEVTNKATRNYTVGSYLIMNNTLYKVTSAIANGGTITVGSNVSATTIMAEILAL